MQAEDRTIGIRVVRCKGPPPDCRRIVTRLRYGIKRRSDRRATSKGQSARLTSASRGGQQDKGMHYFGGAAVADPRTVLGHGRVSLSFRSWRARLPAGRLAPADQVQAGYQPGHPMAVARVVVRELGQHESFLDADLDL